MERNLVYQIYKLVPIKGLKSCLFQHNYEDALILIRELDRNYYHFKDEFELFDMIRDALKEKNRAKLETTVDYARHSFIIDLVTKIIMYHQTAEENPTVKKCIDIVDDYFMYRCLLTQTERIGKKELEWAATEIDALSKKDNSTYDMLNWFLDLPVKSNNSEVQVEYVEGLIHGNALTYWNLMIGIINGDLVPFMKNFYLLEMLRRKYAELTQPNMQRLRVIIINNREKKD